MDLYLLDTCTVSDFFSGIGGTRQKLAAISPAQIAPSTVTVMEVLYGFKLNPAVERKFSDTFRSLSAVIQIVPFDESTAENAARIRAGLKSKGTAIGSWDLLIGATAAQHDCILVTSNTREFERIEGLKIENWR